MTESGRVSDAIAQVEKDLAALWAPEEGAPPKTRACTANLVVVSSMSHRSGAIDLTDRLETAEVARTFVLALDPRLPPWAVEASVNARCRKDDRGLVCAERIDLSLGAATFPRAPSVVASLAMPDVPTLVVVFDSSPQVLASELARDAARVVVDSQSLGLEAACEIARSTPGCFVDLAWERLYPWRNQLARCFDEPALRPAVTAIRRVAITTAGRTETMSRDARLILGWLATRLGWRFPEQGRRLVAVDPLHAPIELSVAPSDASAGVGALAAIEVDALLDDTRVAVTIRRDGSLLRVDQVAPGLAHASRTTPFVVPPLPDLLDRALARPEPDHVLRATIAAAASLPSSNQVTA